MIELDLDVEDLVGMRFAVSPLMETVMSLRTPLLPTYFVLQMPWWRRVEKDVAHLDMRPLASLVGVRRWVPDFLTPRPEVPVPDFEDELEIVRRTPPEKVAADIRRAHAGRPVPSILRLDEPARLRDRLADLLREYWETALAPYWTRMRGVLEADMLYRARQFTRGGARLLFADLHPAVRWEAGVLRLDVPAIDYRVDVTGRGLCLMPCLFVRSTAPPISADEPPSLAYPARGIATLWETERPTGGEAIVALIGRRKATLLGCLDRPASTLDLAERLGVTPGAVSQHLSVLHGAGLVTRARVGRVVLYARSELGSRLLAR
ncbi:ArsR family transcriptional regulator [Actinoallomurus iriomotensis]|uniref:Transcriptional regulator n=1 Tax=Actinoallomurus iriomotensis TaxID=478107 RepID=A0A9W6RMN0_9ACTN|nr:ArsR family transcriptional regulator [Actinoallomurus iriomotensis]GLY77895.1 transcriptional regulator [Actinoallomurus iriomotensis]